MNSTIRCFAVSLIGIFAVVAAHGVDLPQDSAAREQREADLRVIAARCGTPTFESAFFRQSTQAVKAGLISSDRPPAEVEKAITAKRRSAFALVASKADCTAQLAELVALQRSRIALIKAARPAARSNGNQ